MYGERVDLEQRLDCGAKNHLLLRSQEKSGIALKIQIFIIPRVSTLAVFFFMCILLVRARRYFGLFCFRDHLDTRLWPVESRFLRVEKKKEGESNEWN